MLRRLGFEGTSMACSLNLDLNLQHEASSNMPGCAQVLRRLGFEGTSVAKTAKSQARVILFNYWCAFGCCRFRCDGTDVSTLQQLLCTLHAHVMSCSAACQPCP